MEDPAIRKELGLGRNANVLKAIQPGFFKLDGEGPSGHVVTAIRMLMASRLECNSQFCAVHYATADAFDVSSLQVHMKAGALVYVQLAPGPRSVVNLSEHDAADPTPVKNASVKKLWPIRCH
jgi:hypothetical protein